MPTFTAGYRPLSPSLASPKGSQRAGGSAFKRIVICFLLLLPSLVFLGAALVLSLLGLKFNDTDKNYGCDPEGNVWISSKNRPNLWGKDYGLAITLGFGEFSFTLAKSIDILWDLVIGRGSQVLAGVLIYFIFRGPVVQMMERSTVPYEKVLKMEYHPTGLSAFFTYCKDVHRRGRSKWQWFTVFMMALSAAYVLIMPTLVSAMTGYQPLDKPLLQTSPTTYVTFEDLEHCAYVVEDGARVGLGNDACISKNSKAYAGVAHCEYGGDLVSEGAALTVFRSLEIRPLRLSWHLDGRLASGECKQHNLHSRPATAQLTISTPEHHSKRPRRFRDHLLQQSNFHYRRTVQNGHMRSTKVLPLGFLTHPALHVSLGDMGALYPTLLSRCRPLLEHISAADRYK
jgi:hypothetical protein